VRIDVQRRADVGVPEHRLHRLRCLPKLKHKAGEGVATVMESNGWYACLLQQRLKVAGEIPWGNRLAIEVATSWPLGRALAVLLRLVTMHDTPRFVRSDKGPEFIARAICGWLAQPQTRTLHINAGCPWQNGYGESFNGTVHDECLNMYVFHSVAEARVTLAAYHRQYNEERPHRRLR
jgi:hypothetical protein